MGKLKTKLTNAYIKNIKRWMFCPVCGDKMNIRRETDTWICEKCNCELPSKVSQKSYAFWFCDSCKAFLNSQQGFLADKEYWICAVCGFENRIDANNIVTLCKNCGEKLPKGSRRSLCDECRAARFTKAVKWGVRIATVVGTAIYYSKNSADNTDANSDGSKNLEDISYPICKTCGHQMTEFDGWAWYTCPVCGDSVRIIDGTITWEEEIFGSPAQRAGGLPCQNCGQSLSGGSYTMPWENGNNPDGYIKCPHCGYINFQWIDDE